MDANHRVADAALTVIGAAVAATAPARAGPEDGPVAKGGQIRGALTDPVVMTNLLEPDAEGRPLPMTAAVTLSLQVLDARANRAVQATIAVARVLIVLIEMTARTAIAVTRRQQIGATVVSARVTLPNGRPSNRFMMDLRFPMTWQPRTSTSTQCAGCMVSRTNSSTASHATS